MNANKRFAQSMVCNDIGQIYISIVYNMWNLVVQNSLVVQLVFAKQDEGVHKNAFCILSFSGLVDGDIYCTDLVKLSLQTRFKLCKQKFSDDLEGVGGP